MTIICIFLMLFSCGMILFHRRDDIYDKVVTFIFLLFVAFFSYVLGNTAHIPNSYLSSMNISDMVHDCQKDLPPYAKCVIKVVKPTITEN